MKTKLLIICLVLTSLIGYLEWGKDNKMFLFQVEAGILSKLFIDPKSVIHPFVLLPLFGQVLLLISLFRKQPGRKLVTIGIIAISVLFLFLLFIGIIGLNYRIVLSVVPFILTAMLTLIHYRKKRVRSINPI